MRIQKVMAIAPHLLEAMATENLQYQSSSKPDCLSSQIDYLLAGFVFALQDKNLSLPEQTTALHFIDRLLRFKIDIRQSQGVSRGC